MRQRTRTMWIGGCCITISAAPKSETEQPTRVGKASAAKETTDAPAKPRRARARRPGRPR